MPRGSSGKLPQCFPNPEDELVRLTAKTVAALQLGGKTDVIHFDQEMPGFGFRLRAGSGGTVRRSWVVQYRRAGASRRVLLGSAEVLGAEAARAAAKKVLAKVALGEDPANARADRRDKDRLSMRAVAAEFLAAKEPDLAARTFVEAKRYLTDPRYLGPLHGMPIDTITRKDVAALVLAITRERGAPTASRARGALGGFFSWAMRMGLIEANPTIGAIKPTEAEPRERTLSDAEMTAIWQACKDDDYGKIVKLLILTACRRAEIGDLAWPEIDLDRESFTIPRERSKNGKAHTLPLMPMALQIIRAVPRMASREQLFGQHSHGFTGWAKSKAALDTRSAVSDWVLHDVRRSTATKMADLGVPPHVIEQILNHVGGHKAGVSGIYNRSSYEREVRNALAMWEDHVRALVEGGERKIHSLPRAAS
jgi:integrase